MGLGKQQMKTGRIVTYFEERGFGFIHEYVADASSTKKLNQWFFHISSCICEPKARLEVKFEIAEGKKGPMAVNVDVFQAAPQIPGLEALSGKAGV
jgi:cold shock CspA family protein